MNTEIIEDTFKKTFAGAIAFPQVVAKYIGAGIERYHIDLIGFQKTSYGAQSGFYQAPFALQNAPIVAKEFNAALVKASILDSQQGKIDYQTFLQRIMQAGCSHYEVYLTGRKAVYFGRNGAQHIEHFPPGLA